MVSGLAPKVLSPPAPQPHDGVAGHCLGLETQLRPPLFPRRRPAPAPQSAARFHTKLRWKARCPIPMVSFNHRLDKQFDKENLQRVKIFTSSCGNIFGFISWLSFLKRSAAVTFSPFPAPCSAMSRRHAGKALPAPCFQHNIKHAIYFLHSILLCTFASDYADVNIPRGRHHKI